MIIYYYYLILSYIPFSYNYISNPKDINKSLLSLKQKFNFDNFQSTITTQPLYSHKDANKQVILSQDTVHKREEEGLKLQSRLNGCSLFLVGMMGTGKTTVGEIISRSMCHDYNFFIKRNM